MKWTRHIVVIGCVFLLIAGCGKKESTDGGSGGGGASAGAANADPSVISGTGDSDAVKALVDELGKHWLKTADGWVSEYPSRVSMMTGERAGPESFYRQIKALKFSIDNSGLNDSDKLNGVQFEGMAQFENSPIRLFNDPNAFGGPKWSDWHASNESVHMLKKNGQWQMVGTVGGYMVNGTKPSESVVANLK